MKKLWKEIMGAAVLGLLVPSVALGLAAMMLGGESAAEEPEQTQPSATGTETVPAPSFSLPVLMADGTTEEMELDDYLTGVVLGEMPADFEIEAKKAQAVVARTYALKAHETGSKHPDGAVCTDPACCQGYMAPEDFLAAGGSQESLEQVRQAVLATHDQVLTYEGALIEATYFSCSGGRTEDAVAVWGTDVPYLRATDSPGEEEAAHYTDTVTFSAAEFAGALGVKLSGTPSSWLGNVAYTDGGGVETMEIGGILYKGTTLRQLLNLRSTAFSMIAVGDEITVTTKGYGHRVGMSQYGADAMAVAGSSYTEILAHYYQGTQLEVYSGPGD